MTASNQPFSAAYNKYNAAQRSAKARQLYQDLRRFRRSEWTDEFNPVFESLWEHFTDVKYAQMTPEDYRLIECMAEHASRYVSDLTGTEGFDLAACFTQARSIRQQWAAFACPAAEPPPLIQHVLLLGPSGSGKDVLAHSMAEATKHIIGSLYAPNLFHVDSFAAYNQFQAVYGIGNLMPAAVSMPVEPLWLHDNPDAGSEFGRAAASLCKRYVAVSCSAAMKPIFLQLMPYYSDFEPATDPASARYRRLNDFWSRRHGTAAGFNALFFNALRRVRRSPRLTYETAVMQTPCRSQVYDKVNADLLKQMQCRKADDAADVLKAFAYLSPVVTGLRSTSELLSVFKLFETYQDVAVLKVIWLDSEVPDPTLEFSRDDVHNWTSQVNGCRFFPYTGATKAERREPGVISYDGQYLMQLSAFLHT